MRKVKPPVLRPHEEEAILKDIFGKAKRGEPVLREEVINKVIEFIRSDMRKNPFRDGQPGDKWFSLFRRRHNSCFMELTPKQLMAVEKVGFTEKVMNTVVYSQGKVRPHTSFITGSPSALGIPVIRKVRPKSSTTPSETSTPKLNTSTPKLNTSTPKLNTSAPKPNTPALALYPANTETPSPMSDESNNTTATDDGDTKSQEGINDSNDFQPGSKLEVMDFNDKWYPVKVVEVDYEEGEVLVHYEKWSDRYDEWVSMDSNRIRRPSLAMPNSKKVFEENEKVIAVWAYNHKYPATVKKVLPNGVSGIQEKTQRKKIRKENVYMETKNENSSEGVSDDNISTECLMKVVENRDVGNLPCDDLTYVKNENICEEKLEPLCFVDVSNIDEDFNLTQQHDDGNVVTRVSNQTKKAPDEYSRIKRTNGMRVFRSGLSSDKKEIMKMKDSMRYQIRKQLGKVKSIKQMSPSEHKLMREKWKLHARKHRLKLKMNKNSEVVVSNDVKGRENSTEAKTLLNVEEIVTSPTSLKKFPKIGKTIPQRTGTERRKLKSEQRKEHDNNGVQNKTMTPGEYRKMKNRDRMRLCRSKFSIEQKEILSLKAKIRYQIRKQNGEVKSINQLSPYERKLMRNKWKSYSRKYRLKLKRSEGCHEAIESHPLKDGENSSENKELLNLEEFVSSPQQKELPKMRKRKSQMSIEEKRKFEREKKRKYRIIKKQELLLKKEKLKKEKEMIKLKLLMGLPADYCYQCDIKNKKQKTDKTKLKITTIEDKRAHEREKKRDWRARKRIEEERKEQDNSPFRYEPCCCKKKKTIKGRPKKKKLKTPVKES